MLIETQNCMLERQCVFANVSMCSWVALGAPNAGIYSLPNECDI